MTTGAGGTQVGTQTYYPYGSLRTSSGNLYTDYTFTGQKVDANQLMFYASRYYDPSLGRFAQPDSIVPNVYNPQSLNRYAYVLNSPLKYTDPTGHFECEDAYGCPGGPPAPAKLPDDDASPGSGGSTRDDSEDKYGGDGGVAKDSASRNCRQDYCGVTAGVSATWFLGAASVDCPMCAPVTLPLTAVSAFLGAGFGGT